jgi:3-isopropylmalate/(R)-2-methylmalate dehydratase large subunit
MGLKPGQKAEDIDLGYVFLGSCTNARLSDFFDQVLVPYSCMHVHH